MLLKCGHFLLFNESSLFITDFCLPTIYHISLVLSVSQFLDSYLTALILNQSVVHTLLKKLKCPSLKFKMCNIFKDISSGNFLMISVVYKCSRKEYFETCFVFVGLAKFKLSLQCQPPGLRWCWSLSFIVFHLILLQLVRLFGLKEFSFVTFFSTRSFIFSFFVCFVLF